MSGHNTSADAERLKRVRATLQRLAYNYANCTPMSPSFEVYARATGADLLDALSELDRLRAALTTVMANRAFAESLIYRVLWKHTAGADLDTDEGCRTAAKEVAEWLHSVATDAEYAADLARRAAFHPEAPTP